MEVGGAHKTGFYEIVISVGYVHVCLDYAVLVAESMGENVNFIGFWVVAVVFLFCFSTGTRDDD